MIRFPEKTISKGRKTIIFYKLIKDNVLLDSYLVELLDIITDEVKAYDFDTRKEAIQFMSELYDTL